MSASSRVVTISTTHFHISVYTCSYFSLASLELIVIVIIHTCSCIVSVVISTAIRLSLHLIIVSLPLLHWFRLIVTTPAHFIIGIFTTRAYSECLHPLMSFMSITHFHISVYTCFFLSLVPLEFILIQLL